MRCYIPRNLGRGLSGFSYYYAEIWILQWRWLVLELSNSHFLSRLFSRVSLSKGRPMIWPSALVPLPSRCYLSRCSIAQEPGTEDLPPDETPQPSRSRKWPARFFHFLPNWLRFEGASLNRCAP